ncbi:MAG: hypothetical protein Terrestrivirus13_3 [Terrestrivirus sp.]|uniref:Uncharacterized protein n=1 Tax=Terrestrivirus sp. TaxID=2487775 RepID=A0A3G4ZPC4_9VIRU|nr:MAG: hypothetical protein Terrestrivirus13_3 [Terrestrivirus sp.]
METAPVSKHDSEDSEESEDLENPTRANDTIRKVKINQQWQIYSVCLTVYFLIFSMYQFAVGIFYRNDPCNDMNPKDLYHDVSKFNIVLGAIGCTLSSLLFVNIYIIIEKNKRKINIKKSLNVFVYLVFVSILFLVVIFSTGLPVYITNTVCPLQITLPFLIVPVAYGIMIIVVLCYQLAKCCLS